MIASVEKAAVLESPVVRGGSGNVSPDTWAKVRLLGTICLVILLAAGADHFAAIWLGLPKPKVTYRRIGPENGPQVFLAGSSDIQFALSWPEVSNALGQGIENWGSAGTTPTEWEESQKLATNTNLMIIGVSVYNLNEYFLCDIGPSIVPISQTIQDLWNTKPGWQISKRSLSQYPLSYVRKLFPTAARSDAFLVGLRKKLREVTGSPLSAEDSANFIVLPSKPVLNFGDSRLRLTDWPPDKTLRRVALVREEIRGMYAFNGPKRLALQRMLLRARHQGGIIVVVLPVSAVFAREFVTPEVLRNFEQALTAMQSSVPEAQFVRLDKLSSLNSDDYYSDFLHLNGQGKQIATKAFLSWLGQHDTDLRLHLAQSPVFRQSNSRRR